MEISYDRIQLDAAVVYLCKKNAAAKARGVEGMKQKIIDHMWEIAHLNKWATIATLGYIVVGGGTNTSIHHFNIYVDPSVGVNGDYVYESR